MTEAAVSFAGNLTHRPQGSGEVADRVMVRLPSRLCCLGWLCHASGAP
jgi:hypothetical protein